MDPNRTDLQSPTDGEQVREKRTPVQDRGNGAPPAPVERTRDADQEQPEQPNDRPKVVNPLAPDDGREVTKDEYWAKWYEHPYVHIDVSYEWNNGFLEAKSLPNSQELDLSNWFLDITRRYLESKPIASLINLETGFSLTMLDFDETIGVREAVRKPDIGVILNTNPVSWGGINQRAFAGVCDMCIEALSDSNSAEVRRDTEEKKRDYARAGVKEYIILDPKGQHMHFYRLNAEGRYEEIQPDADGVIRMEVLPGFQFRLRDLFSLPKLKDLALDEVYSGYVLPEFKASVAEAASQTAARQQAEEQAEAHAVARQQAEDRAAAAEDMVQALNAELDRLRQQSP